MNMTNRLSGLLLKFRVPLSVDRTDADGAFTVKDIPANATLEVSYVGYEKQSIPVNGKNFVLVKLKEANQLLNEVVVVGYGYAEKSQFDRSCGNHQCQRNQCSSGE